MLRAPGFANWIYRSLRKRPGFALKSQAMWLQLRAWWYLHGKEKSNMPRDVREYILRRYLKAAIESAKTQEAKNEIVSRLMEGALRSENNEISEELRNELIKTAFELVEDLPVTPLPVPPGPYPSTHRPKSES
jgi:hypothetical protein